MDVTLVTVEGSKKLQSIKLRSEDTIVGRREGCDLRIPAPAVSRRHCRLSFQDDLLTIEDLGSANGTYVNGQSIDQPMIVRPGDRLTIGPVTFLVEYPLTTAAEARLAELHPHLEEAAELAAVIEEDEVVVGVGEEAAELAAVIEEDDVVGVEVEDDEPFQGLLLEDEPETVQNADSGTGTDFDLGPPPPEKKKKKPAPARQVSEDPEGSLLRGWELPQGGDLRDILEQLGDGKKE